MSVASFDYDVIIVGARPSGASLAIHLARQELSVLLIDKDDFPSNPSISCPVIFASTMQLLDELGVDENEYAYGTPKIFHFSVDVKDYFNVVYDIPFHKERNYVYAIDRKRFDFALIKKVREEKNITVQCNFKVTKVLRKNELVAGIIGQYLDEEVVEFTARCIVGADGRFSTIAELVHSPITKEWKYPNSSILYNYWKGVKPYHDGEPTVQFYVPESGLLYMLLDSADNTTGVIIHGQQKKVYQSGKAKDCYDFHLKKVDIIRDRLKDATQVDKLRGIRILRNTYHKAGGLGWFLTGDALHQRDTLDAQGIYEALLISKLLSHAISMILVKGITWSDAIKWYEETIYAVTKPMCKTTLSRLIWQHRIPWPEWFIKTVIHWLFCDPEYKDRFMRLHLREIEPQKWIDAKLVIRAIWNGLRHDNRRLSQMV